MAAAKGNQYTKGMSQRKGKPNKLTKETKELLKKFVDDNFDTAVEDWANIEDKGLKVKLFIQFLPYAAPRLNSVTVQDANGSDVIRQILESQSK